MISVIVPVYNCIHTIDRCVQAVCAQTMQDWELLLIDDGSTDGSGALCDGFAAQDPRIRVFHKPNGGVSSARNLGLANAAGEYVMFCDSDDWAEPDWCRKLYRAIKADPDCLPICNYYRSTLSAESVNRPVQCDGLDVSIPRADFFCLNQQELLGIPWNKIFRRDILEKNRIRFRADISLGEDLIFNLDYLHCLSGGFAFVNAPLYHYSLGNADSLSAKHYADLPGIYHAVYTRIRDEMHRIPGAWEKWAHLYLRSRFYTFDRIFRNIWSKKNPQSLRGKWHTCAKQFHSDEFQECRSVILNGPMNVLQKLGLKSNCFLLYWMTVAVSEGISKFRHPN